MKTDEIMKILQSVEVRAIQQWWGPSLSGVVSELETCRRYPEYLWAIINTGESYTDTSKMIVEHCLARARINLWDSMNIAIRQFLSERNERYRKEHLATISLLASTFAGGHAMKLSNRFLKRSRV